MSNLLPLIVSYYTENSYYAEEVKGLIQSCEAFGYPYEIVSVPNFGSWERNCCFKPLFLYNLLKNKQKPLLWIDADAEIIRPLDFFTQIDADISVWIDPNLSWEHPSKVISATIYLNAKKHVIELLKKWASRCQNLLNQKERREVWDQTALRDLLYQNQDLNLYPLPQEYCHIFDKECSSNPHIVQYQASRVYKPFMDAQAAKFYTLEEEPIRELKNIRKNFK